VDETAGPNYQPASRIRGRAGTPTAGDGAG